MVFLSDVIVQWIYSVFRYPKALFAIIPTVIVIYYVIKINFVKIDPRFEHVRARLRWVMILSRIMIFTLLIIAIASPFLIKETTIERDPFVKMIIDNSTSMNVFNNEKVSKLKSELEKEILVETAYIGNKEYSALGDGILNSMKTDENILLVTDGQNNKGAKLGDVLLLANKFNSSVNALELEVKNSDLAVSVEGVSRTMKDVENTYIINVNKVGDVEEYAIKLIVDDKVVLDTRSDKEQLKFTTKFEEGSHKIKAEILPISKDDDHFMQNNIFQKSVKVIERPKILLYTKKATPLYELYKPIYDIKQVASLDDVNLNDYYAIILNDIHASEITDQNAFVDFVTNGNGLLAIGGKNSFDKGDYKGTILESIMPAFVSKPGKKEGDVNVVIVIDISGSTKQQVDGTTQVDVEKALGLSIYDDLTPDKRVGLVAFNTKAYMIDPIEFKYKKTGFKEKISKLTYGGGTVIGEGIRKADDMLEKVQGSKNIILISDGVTTAESYSIERALWAARTAVKVYTVGVGKRTKEWFLEELSRVSNGIYFRADQQNKLKILFGDPEKLPGIDRLRLEVLDSNHFITKNIDEVHPKIYGFNQVVPKTPAKLVATTTGGDPLITTWNYALGRVVAYTTDDGSVWAPESLNADNSVLLVRSLNFAIGVPDRKEDEVFHVTDTRINEPTEIIIRTEQYPEAEGILFYKIEKNTYKAEIVPDEIGFGNIGRSVYAVNYPLEYRKLGMNSDLRAIVESSNGKVFKTDQLKEIIEFVHSRSKRVILQKRDIRWPFIILAMIIFLIEVTLRKVIEHHKANKV
jgi:uncharacterized membrane protein/uncharacterized protein YegL